jgi:hypothetical protein
VAGRAGGETAPGDVAGNRSVLLRSVCGGSEVKLVGLLLGAVIAFVVLVELALHKCNPHVDERPDDWLGRR